MTVFDIVFFSVHIIILLFCTCMIVKELTDHFAYRKQVKEELIKLNKKLNKNYD